MANPVAIIHTQCGPYHFARIDAFRSIYSGHIDLIQLTSQEGLRQWKVDDCSIKITTIADGMLEEYPAKHLIKNLVEYLTKTQPAILVVAGYGHPVMRAAIKWGYQKKVPVILLSDSQYCDRPRNPILETLKSRWIRQHCDSAFVAGASAAQYLERLKFPKHKIWRCYDVVDNDYFRDQALEVRENPSAVRAKLGLPEKFVLYVGRFSPEKNLSRLLEAFGNYQKASLDQRTFSLVLVGGGPEEQVLKHKVEQLGLKNIFWPGFKQVDDLPAYYSLASALILPSTSEPWGLVINEAMACGLPVLASSQCGAVWDLVFPGINGLIFNPWSSQSISQAIILFGSYSLDQQRTMGQASQRIIQNFTPETWSLALSDCIATTLAAAK